MNKNGKTALKIHKEQPASSSKTGLFKEDTIVIVLIGLYILVDFIPFLGSMDVRGPQWFYLSVINLLVTGYILINFKNRLNHDLNLFINLPSIYHIEKNLLI